MWALAVDAVTAEVVSAFERAGVDSVLLKGPSIARWLYDDPTEREYVDSDLLVDADLAPRAHDVLQELGFRRGFGPLSHPGMERAPSYAWQRGKALVDLHETLPGAGADRRRVWALLRAGSVDLEVGGRPVRVPGEPARLVHVALHAAHHGAEAERPWIDLERALARVDGERWREAVVLAREIDALPRFATGLGALPGGRALMERLGLDPRLAVDDAPDVPLAGGFRRLAATPGVAARARLVWRELVPSVAFMRWWSPLARRSRRGLAAAYAWRWIYLARHAPRGVAAARQRGPGGAKRRIWG